MKKLRTIDLYLIPLLFVGLTTVILRSVALLTYFNSVTLHFDDKIIITISSVMILLSVIGSGMFGVMQKLQQVKFLKTCDNEFMIVTLFFSAITLFCIGIITNGKNLLYILRHGGIYASVAGLSNGATNLLNLVVNAMIPISIAAPTRSGIKIVISFLISLIIFKEKLSRRQTFGVIIGAIALILLNLKI